MDGIVVCESGGLTGENGTTITLRLLIVDREGRCEMRIERKEPLPHKTLTSVVLRITCADDVATPLGRAMTSIVKELERLHRQGYALRERAGGGWRGAWRAELLAPNRSRPVAGWEIDHKRAAKTLEPLARTLAALDLPAPRGDDSSSDSATLIAAMRAHGEELGRRHAIDAFIASNPSQPADEMLEALDDRGLLGPMEPDEHE